MASKGDLFWRIMNPAVALATVVGLVLAAFQMYQAAQQELRNTELQVELVMLDADRQISSAMFQIAQLQSEISTQQQIGGNLDASTAQLGIAIRQLDSLLVGMNRLGSSVEQLEQSWRRLFGPLCESLLEESYLAMNSSGVWLEGTRNECEKR